MGLEVVLESKDIIEHLIDLAQVIDRRIVANHSILKFRELSIDIIMLADERREAEGREIRISINESLGVSKQVMILISEVFADLLRVAVEELYDKARELIIWQRLEN